MLCLRLRSLDLISWCAVIALREPPLIHNRLLLQESARFCCYLEAVAFAMIRLKSVKRQKGLGIAETGRMLSFHYQTQMNKQILARLAPMHLH